MKKTKWLFICVAVILFFAITASAKNYGDLTYEVSNGEVTITYCNESASGALTIPAEIDGYPVTSIGRRAFWGCGSLTSIEIPSSVTSIGDYAFYGCSGLTSISIPSSVMSIGDGAFEYCRGLKNIVGDLIYTKTTDNPYFLLSGRTRADFTSCEIQKNCKFIGDHVFRDCGALVSVTIPSSVMSIGKGAFDDCFPSTADIYYDGSEAEWKSIDIGPFNYQLARAQIHFAYPLKNGERTDAIVLAVGKLKMWAFGNMVENDAAPKIVNSRTMVPIRFIAEALGATVGWDGATRTATVTKDGKTVEIPIGSAKAKVNGTEMALDSPGFIESNRTYLPLRFVAESLDAKVEWDAEVQEIIIKPTHTLPAGELVVDAIAYTKDVIDCFSGGHYNGGERFSRHTIKIPKLALDTDAAKQFNQKIYATFNDTVDVLKAGTEENYIYMIGYEYSVKNGVVGIIVTDEAFLQYSGVYNPVYEFYYYDVLHDKELTMTEYLAALDVEYADVVKTFNAGWSTNPADKDLIGVVLFPDKTAVLRSGVYGFNMETGETALAVIDKSVG